MQVAGYRYDTKTDFYDNDRETCVIMQNDYQKAMSFRAKRRRDVERSEKSRVHKVGVTEILRYALDDKMIGNFYYDTSSSVCVWMVPYRKIPQKHSNPKLFHNFAKTIKTQRT